MHNLNVKFTIKNSENVETSGTQDHNHSIGSALIEAIVHLLVPYYRPAAISFADRTQWVTAFPVESVTLFSVRLFETIVMRRVSIDMGQRTNRRMKPPGIIVHRCPALPPAKYITGTQYKTNNASLARRFVKLTNPITHKKTNMHRSPMIATCWSNVISIPTVSIPSHYVCKKYHLRLEII
jgi:hypothetical protein